MLNQICNKLLPNEDCNCSYTSEDIVQLIRIGNHKIMNLEKLRDLVKFFQNEEEINLLTNFNGDRQRLASAEKFLMLMLEISK